MSTELTLSDQMSYAQAVVAQPERGSTSLLPAAYRGNPANVLIAVGLGQALGISPAQALYDIYVVNGRPSPSANLMAALARRAGHKLRIKGDATRCTATLIRADDPDEPFEATWTMEQARAAGLAGKDTWKSYPAAMLRARAIAEVVRMGASESVLGMDYSSEEMQDVEPAAPAAPNVKAPGLAGLRAAVQKPDSTPADPIEAAEAHAFEAEMGELVDGKVVDETPEPKLTARQRGKMFALFTQKGIPEAEQIPGIAHIIGRPVEHRDALTADEFDKVIAALEQQPDAEVQP